MVIAYDKGGEDFKPCPAGNHAARVCEIIFIGTVHSEFKGVAKDSPQIKVGFEIPSELREDGTPFVVSTMPITLSVNKKASFRKLAQGIMEFTPEMEKAFDTSMLLGKTCLINVIHTKSKKDANVVYANITGASPLPKGMEVGDPVNTPVNFDVNTSPLTEIADFPEFIQNLITSTPEYRDRVAKGDPTF